VLACPSIRCTTFGFAPAEIASDAAVAQAQWSSGVHTRGRGGAEAPTRFDVSELTASSTSSRRMLESWEKARTRPLDG
jgi:hypothetical protein